MRPDLRPWNGALSTAGKLDEGTPRNLRRGAVGSVSTVDGEAHEYSDDRSGGG